MPAYTGHMYVFHGLTYICRHNKFERYTYFFFQVIAFERKSVQEKGRAKTLKKDVKCQNAESLYGTLYMYYISHGMISPSLWEYHAKI